MSTNGYTTTSRTKILEFLKNNEEFTTEFLNIGDGISVSKRRDEE